VFVMIWVSVYFDVLKVPASVCNDNIATILVTPKCEQNAHHSFFVGEKHFFFILNNRSCQSKLSIADDSEIRHYL
jgi:hypothetical protein